MASIAFRPDLDVAEPGTLLGATMDSHDGVIDIDERISALLLLGGLARGGWIEHWGEVDQVLQETGGDR